MAVVVTSLRWKHPLRRLLSNSQGLAKDTRLADINRRKSERDKIIMILYSMFATSKTCDSFFS